MTDTAGLSPYEKYTLLIGEIEKEVLEADESAGWYARHIGGVNDRGAARYGWWDAYDRKQSLLKCIAAHRSYLPYVRMGLMTVVEAVKEVRAGHSAKPL